MNIACLRIGAGLNTNGSISKSRETMKRGAYTSFSESREQCALKFSISRHDVELEAAHWSVMRLKSGRMCRFTRFIP